MAFVDFVVYHDETEESPRDLALKIFYSVFIVRIQENMPCTIFINGNSGTGKSISGGLKMQQILMMLQGITDIKPYLDVMNVYTPFEYPQKIQKLLFDKDFKDINIICIHESRELVNAKKWQDFLTQSVASVNAMSRSVKRMITIFISQFIRDVSNDIRNTLDFYITMTRPRGMKSRMTIYKFWKDDRDPDRPRLCKRRLFGYIVNPKTGVRTPFCPTHFEIDMPEREIVETFELQDRLAKTEIIKKKTDKLINEMKRDIGIDVDRIDELVKYYSADPMRLAIIGRNTPGGFKVRPDTQKLHDMSNAHFKKFEVNLLKSLEKKGEVVNVPTE